MPDGILGTLDPSPPLPLAVTLSLAALPAAAAAGFAAASAAMAALSPARRRALRDSLAGDAQRAWDRYLRHPARVETSWLVLRVIGLASGALLIHEVLPSRLGHWTTWLAVALALVAYGIPAEISRAVAIRTPERWAPRLLRVARPLEVAVFVLAVPLSWLGSLVGRLLERPARPTARLTEDEVEIIVTEGELNGSLDHERSEMIRNVLDFRDVTAGEVMVPRTQIVGLDIEVSPQRLLEHILGSQHSRYPVYHDRIDNVVGILHVKDVVTTLARDGSLDRVKVSDIVRRPVGYVTEGQSASSILKEMRVRRQHMAIVLDEFGSVSGLVTLEDLIEKIVGDIRDEHDRDEPSVVDLGEGRVMVDASMPMADLSRHLGTDLPEGDDYNSVGGFIVARLGRVPAVGARIRSFGYEFVVRDADERHVASVEIVRADPSLPPASSHPTGPSAG